ncbi:MAG: hypothetical protein NTW86_23930 [Candidatus Sumerlaeota bacterium]|nr:hypothetical protein [Candidatus Sumerlaeota bacterium]
MALTVPNEWHLNDTSLYYALWRLDRNATARSCAKAIRSVPRKAYDCVVILDPPRLDDTLCPYGMENTAAIQGDSAWSCAAQFPHGDGRTIKLFFPAKKEEKGIGR